MSRWISCVLPRGPVRPSRRLRVSVARGSMAYSAVIQPCPESCKNEGTPSSTLTAHSTCVCPVSIVAEPSANISVSVAILVGRSSS